jgi:hypothetical protein
MRRAFIAVLAASLFGPAAAMPAMAGQSELSTFLFGRNYNDGVIAVSVRTAHWEDERDASHYVFPSRIRIAQAAVAGDPALLEALARRNIAPHNVLWVRTAANGGRVVYYR